MVTGRWNRRLGTLRSDALHARMTRFTGIGIDDGFMRELGEAFEPGTSVFFVLVREARNQTMRQAA